MHMLVKKLRMKTSCSVILNKSCVNSKPGGQNMRTGSRFPQNPHKILWRIAFHPCYRQNEVPPAGVAGLKTRRKVYWATVGNRRPNVASLVIDNKSSFLARLRPLNCHTYDTQKGFQAIQRLRILLEYITGSVQF